MEAMDKMKKVKQSKKLEIIYLPASSLVKLPGNPRRDTDPDAIGKLAVLIKAHGFQNPLQVFKENGTYTIIAGNHRYDAGLSLGMTDFPCLVYEGDRKAALARAISDNKSAEWSEGYDNGTGRGRRLRFVLDGVHGH
jgi:ParB/RepB/Spo0J family partition protein